MQVPSKFPEGQNLVLCVVGARPAHGVCPDRPDANDVTLQVLAFDKLGREGTVSPREDHTVSGNGEAPTCATRRIREVFWSKFGQVA